MFPLLSCSSEVHINFENFHIALRKGSFIADKVAVTVLSSQMVCAVQIHHAGHHYTAITRRLQAGRTMLHTARRHQS